MKKHFVFTTFLIFIASRLMAVDPQVQGSMEYKVSMPNPHTHYFEVEIILNNYDKNYVDFKMPVWTPGSYLVREYAKNVEGFSAFAMDGKVLSFQKQNKNTWRIEHSKGKNVLIKYSVYAFEGTIRMSYLDDGHAFIMANTLLMFVEDLRNTSTVLKINVPDQWKKITTSLTQLEGKSNAFYVPNYDILVDSPIEIGNHDILEFTAANVPHQVVLYGASQYKAERIKKDLTKIIEEATDIFDENPNEKYIFFIHHSDKKEGGLEHLNSTALGVSRWTYTNPDLYNYLLSLVAHEYFHLWMVKRLKPVELEFIDYDQEIYTDLLWVMEGITSYYEEKIMLRSGFYDEHKFLQNLLAGMSMIQNIPGSSEQSVAEASFDAWIKYYKRNENSSNNQVSYYDKGMILGALLDLEIINGSGGEKTLDDVVSQLYYQFYKKKGKGIVAEDVRKFAEKESSTNLESFFNDYVYGTKELDNAKYLQLAGITLVEINNSTNTKSIGLNFDSQGQSIIVTSLVKGGSAFENGIYVGDELLSINGYRIFSNNINELIGLNKVGDVATFLINRKGKIKTIELDIRKDNRVNYTYEYLESNTKQQERVYKTWLGK